MSRQVDRALADDVRATGDRGAGARVVAQLGALGLSGAGGDVVHRHPGRQSAGAAGAALTLKAKRGGVLIALLVLPFFIPTLIFGISAISAVVTPPGSFLSPLLITVAISLVALVIGPVAAAAALRVQAE